MKKSKALDYPFIVFIAIVYLIIYIVQYTDGVFDKNLYFPQLMLPATLFTGMFLGDRVGAIFGFFIGTAVDAVSAETICYNGIFMLLVGYFVGVLVQFVLNNNFRSALIVSSALTLLYYFGLWVINDFDKPTLTLCYIPSYFITVFSSIILYLSWLLFLKIRKRQLQNKN